ncbi:hypothetical protein HID58_095868, partial [Brassica napus]
WRLSPWLPSTLASLPYALLQRSPLTLPFNSLGSARRVLPQLTAFLGFARFFLRDIHRRLSEFSEASDSTVFAHKGYKMKTHKASAKRFRVTGRGKIVRRRSGKQHLLAKKNNKRKLRLSKMHEVSRSDYDM